MPWSVIENANDRIELKWIRTRIYSHENVKSCSKINLLTPQEQPFMPIATVCFFLFSLFWRSLCYIHFGAVVCTKRWSELIPNKLKRSQNGHMWPKFHFHSQSIFYQYFILYTSWKPANNLEWQPFFFKGNNLKATPITL